MVSLQNTVLTPHFILTLHTSEAAQSEYMRALGIYSETDIKKALQSREDLIEYNQEHAGSFCHFISTGKMKISFFFFFISNSCYYKFVIFMDKYLVWKDRTKYIFYIL